MLRRSPLIMAWGGREMLRLILAGTCAWAVCFLFMLLFFAGASKLDTPEPGERKEKT